MWSRGLDRRKIRNARVITWSGLLHKCDAGRLTECNCSQYQKPPFKGCQHLLPSGKVSLLPRQAPMLTTLAPPAPAPLPRPAPLQHLPPAASPCRPQLKSACSQDRHTKTVFALTAPHCRPQALLLANPD